MDPMLEEMVYCQMMATLTPEEAKAYADMRREVNSFILDMKLEVARVDSALALAEADREGIQFTHVRMENDNGR